MQKEVFTFRNLKADCTKKLRTLFENLPDNSKVTFEKGEYHLSQKKSIKADYSLSHTISMPSRNLAVLIKNKKNITIDGGGSTFLFEGALQPFTLDSCENVTFKNIIIDWKKTPVAEGTIESIRDDYIDIKIDQDAFPCFVKNFCLCFDIDSDSYAEITYGGHTLYDSKSLMVIPGTDNINIQSTEQLSSDTFRLYICGGTGNITSAKKGDIFVIRHGIRQHSVFFQENCSNITFENITIHASNGFGILSQFSSNILCKNINILPNKKRGRRISCTRDYGIQFSNCSGDVVVENCSFHGLQDSPVEIYGTCVNVSELLSNNSILCAYSYPEFQNFKYWAKEGDKIVFRDKKTYKDEDCMIVTRFEYVDKSSFILHFKDEISLRIKKLIAKNILTVENKTNMPSVFIRNNNFGSTRALGLFLSSSNTSVIENNYFSSSGAAILIFGDHNFMYKTGASNDITIRNNTFSDACCLSKFELCHAVITISPKISSPSKKYPYHKNIKISDNTIISSGVPFIYAFSGDNISVTKNKFFRSARESKYKVKGGSLFYFDYCQNTKIADNSIVGDFEN